MNTGFSAIRSLGPSALLGLLRTRTASIRAAPPVSSVTMGPRRLRINLNQTFTEHLYARSYAKYFEIKTTLKKVMPRLF